MNYDEKILTTNMYDIAVVDRANRTTPSLYEGRVTMISLRGINVSSPIGTFFSKWENVKSITKPR